MKEAARLQELSDRAGAILAGIASGHKDLGRETTHSRQELQKISEDARRRLARHINEQRKVLRTYNIALFGRTGAGKSTLLTALGRLDGHRVSQGESDWTTTVEPIEWNECLLYDTPGINGWGRTRSRDDLEAAARRAVEVADVVVLCFDTQSQQASEFEKVSAWVRDYGKPVIAVLNVRNLRWRHPAKVAKAKSRARLSESVHQHAQNISDELAQIGIPHTPVVAIHGKRALHARAALPFRGPDAKNFQIQRDEHGIEYLERWSNITVLEELIAAMVRTGGTDLRTESLRGGVRAQIRETDRRLRDFETEAGAYLRKLDRLLVEAFDTLGYPTQERVQHLWDDSAATDLVTLAESVRGKPFRSPRLGRLDRQATHLARSHLGRLRTVSMGKAEEVIGSAFDRKQEISKHEFEQAVFDRPAIDEAIHQVWQQSKEFLDSQLSMAASEGRTDIRIETTNLTRIRGGAGDTLHKTGKTLRLSGLAGGLTSVVLGLAVANIWNPLGWGAGAVGLAFVGAGIFSSLTGWGGSRAQRTAEQRRLRSRSGAIGRTRRAINHTFDTVELDLTRDIHQEAWRSAASGLRPMLEEFIGLHTARRDSVEARRQLSRESGAIPDSPPAAAVLERAQELLTANARAGGSSTEQEGHRSSIKHLLLGDDWIGDELAPATLPNALNDHLPLLQEHEDQDRDRLRSALQAAWWHLDPEATRSWYHNLAELSGTDAEVHQILASSRFIRYSEKPSVVIVGDYSSGKTSFLKRILVESGSTSTQELDVRGNPTTATTTAYELDRIQLIDTPGFQSGNRGHDEEAIAAVRKAALVVFLFHVNLLIGDTGYLRHVVTGSETSVGKGPRTLFLINRCDELGPDPTESPREYLQRRTQKESELAAALASAGLPVHDDQILGISSDPFGQVGDTPAVNPSAYDDANRAWDGIRPLREALLAEVDRLDTAGREIAAIEYATSELMALDQRLQDVQEAVTARIRDRRGFLTTLGNAMSEAQLLADSLTRRANSLCHDYASGCLADVLDAGDRDAPAKVERFLNWWKDEPFKADLEQFQKEAGESVSQWEETYDSVISRHLRATERPGPGPVPDPGAGPADLRDSARILDAAKTPLEISKLGTSVFRNRNAYYQAGKLFGVRFKPWQATKGAARLSKLGPALSVAGLALDTASLWKDERDRARKEKALVEASRWANKSADEIAGKIASENDRRLVSYLHEQVRQLDGVRTDLRQTQDDDSARRAELERRRAAISELIKSADEPLGGADEGRTDHA